jgi:hypothetical protein
MNDNVKISSNTAANGGGGVYAANSAKFTMNDNAKISENTAAGTGGGVSVANTAKFTMSGNTEISGNNVGSSSHGGGVYMSVASGGTFKMEGGTIKNHILSGGTGGGVCVLYQDTSGPSPFTMNGGIISGNTALNGGGVFFYGNVNTTEFFMEGGTISGNTARDDGGGVYMITGKFTMKGGTIGDSEAENTAAGKGGGVYVINNGTFTMEGGTIGGNWAGNNGGGVSVENNCGFNKSGGTINGNDTSLGTNFAQSLKGHAVYAVYMGATRQQNYTAGTNLNLDSSSTNGWDVP